MSFILKPQAHLECDDEDDPEKDVAAAVEQYRDLKIAEPAAYNLQ